MVTERMISPKELAALLQVPLQTIYQWRYRGGGPRGYRVGRHVRFRMSDVEAWLADRAEEPLDR